MIEEFRLVACTQIDERQQKAKKEQKTMENKNLIFTGIIVIA